MMTFDAVLPELLRLCESDPGFASVGGVTKACAVRDPRGCVRLVIEPNAHQSQADVEALKLRLEATLLKDLRDFFVRPVLTTQDRNVDGKVARALLDKAAKWTDAAFQDPTSRQPVTPTAERWYLLERRVAKQGWLDPQQADEPWPLVRKVPVVTFYSFKGGVGRTTALISCALQLAEQKQRVVIIDLDLEAPGVGPVLGVDTRRGVLDVLVDHLATGQINLEDAHAPTQAFGPEVAENIEVIPAGRLDRGFLEKLARLDFAVAGPWGDEKTIPTHRSLLELLKVVAKKLEPKPNVILLDARAGLHDLAGLSLHGLAHVDVIVTRASEQAYLGLNLTVEALARRKTEDKLRTVIVHGFAPPDEGSPVGKAEVAEVRARAEKIFSDHVYKQESKPSEDDEEAAHFPWRLKSNPNLERITSIASVREELRTEQHRRLLGRVLELCAPEEPATADGTST